MDLSETLKELKTRQKRAQLMGILPIFLCALAAGLMIAQLVPIGGVVAALTLLFYFLVVRRKKAAYNDALARTNIRFGLCGEMEESEYTDREGLTAGSLEELAMLPIEGKSSLLVRQGFQTRSGDAILRGWEMTFNYPDKTGSKTAYKFLSGTILTAESEGETDPACDCLLLRSGLLAPEVETAFIKGKGYRSCPCPEELAENYHLYTRGDLDQLPAHWQRRVQKLAGETPTLGALRLSPQAAAVYLGNRFYTEKVKPSFLPTEGQLKHNPLPERDGVWELFRYWASANKNK